MATAHIFLPSFNKEEFYFLFQWDLYSFTPQKFAHDLTWDQGKTFLLRDHKEQLRNMGMGRGFVFQTLLNRRNTRRIKKDYKAWLLRLCQCESIQFVKLKGSLTDHFIYKNPLEIVESIEL
ncbi:MAG: hypothetical protein OXJ52_06235 [Oligoflexia bacterium]|nr:hypothetical protein [Oligoflexia bacterium]